jgi:FAD/FMN-containing dehydrogenase
MTTNDRIDQALRQRVSGPVTGAGDDDWERLRHGWNLAADQQPLAVVEVDGVPDIVAAVRFAAERGLSVAAQPTGHGVSPAMDGTIVLRTGVLQGIELDAERRRVRVEAGVRWQQLNEVLTGTGLSGLPGSTGDVSVVGFTLGGGLSWFGRKHGLGAERLLAADLVDAAGNHQRVTADADPELFWALRGGGGDFGIVTAVELELVECPEVYGGRLTWPADHATEVLTAFADISATAPDELTLWAWLLNFPDVELLPELLRGRPTVAIDLTYLGGADDCAPWIAPLLERLPEPTSNTLGLVPLAKIGDIAAEPVDPIPALEHPTLLRRFDRSAVEALVAALDPTKPSPVNVVELRHLGGALDRAAPGHGPAGPVGQPYFLFTAGLVAGPPGSLIATIDHVHSAMAPYDSGRQPCSHGLDATLVYPPSVLARLQQVKRKYDPNGVIRSNRPVLPDDAPSSPLS